MLIALVCGFIGGIGLVIYRGLYFGPWNAVINTMGVALAASIIIYVFLHLLLCVGGFFLRILLVIIFAAAILFGGRKLWNTFNPDNPIQLPTSISRSINSFSSGH